MHDIYTNHSKRSGMPVECIENIEKPKPSSHKNTAAASSAGTLHMARVDFASCPSSASLLVQTMDYEPGKTIHVIVTIFSCSARLCISSKKAFATCHKIKSYVVSMYGCVLHTVTHNVAYGPIANCI